MKVLLVEDEQSMLFTLTNLLRRRGHRVIAATSAEKGLEALGDEQVDLVISDLRLPGMDGITLISKVKERCEDVVPIIITAYGTLENAIGALKLGVCDFLRKPFDLHAFEEAISRAERRRLKLLENKKKFKELQQHLVGEERARTILSRFVSKHVRNSILAGEEPQEQLRRVSILFADISDFSSLAESLDQKSLVYMLNSFFAAVEGVVQQHDGFVDKFMGDGIMAIFLPQAEERDNARQAVTAAIGIQWQLADIHRQLLRFELPLFNIHIGISTGKAAACSIGSEEFTNYTYIGEAVNRAKRLQELAGPRQIIVCGQTVAEVGSQAQQIPGLLRWHSFPRSAVAGGEPEAGIFELEYEDPALPGGRGAPALDPGAYISKST